MDPDILLLHQLLQEGHCCSRAMVALGLRLRGEENTALEEAASALCLGVRGGMTCGAFSGAAMVLSMFDAELAATEMIPELAEWFKEMAKEEFGGTDCEDILDGDPVNRVLRCPRLIDVIWKKTKEILEDQGFEFTV